MDNIETIAQAAVAWVKSQGIKPLRIEQVVVEDGVAGTCDLVGELEDGTLAIVDWKTTSKAKDDLPTDAWAEHKEQIGFYTSASLLRCALECDYGRRARAWVVYLSTVEPVAISACEVVGWVQAEKSFRALFDHWCYRNDYDPRKANVEVSDGER